MLVLQRFYKNGTPGPAHLGFEGFVGALLGTGFGAWLFPEEASLFAIFLTSMSANDSVERLLQWNKSLIDGGLQPIRANFALAHRVLFLFAGTVLGYSIIVLDLPLLQAEQLFAHQLEPYLGQTFGTLDFGAALPLLVHNIYVLLFFFVIAIPFRQGGVMLAVAWNASVWGATFGVLSRQWSMDGGPILVESYARVMGATLPHMMIEAAAYVLAGISGVFLSKALLKYSLESAVIVSILRSVGILMVVGVVLVAIGALWEAEVAPILVQYLSSV